MIKRFEGFGKGERKKDTGEREKMIGFLKNSEISKWRESEREEMINFLRNSEISEREGIQQSENLDNEIKRILKEIEKGKLLKDLSEEDMAKLEEMGYKFELDEQGRVRGFVYKKMEPKNK